MLKKYNEMKEEVKNPENVVEYTTQKKWKHIMSVVERYCEQNF